MSESLRSALHLLAGAEEVTLEELLEARELLEVPAARLAARRRSQQHLARLRETIPPQPLRLATRKQFALNRDFHSVVIEASCNTLLAIAAQPVFTVLQTHLARSRLGAGFHRSINEHHRAIAAAIESGSPRAAEREMRSHLRFLRPFYEKGWRQALARRERG